MSDNKVFNLYPIDYPFETLVDRVRKNKLKLDPEFQRKYKWDKDGSERASRFIESCLMRIPLPACYFAEDENKNHLVIDGVQRITTIRNFFENKFALEGLTVYKELNGKKFSELGTLQNDLENYTIRCIVLRNDNAKRLIKDIFARLNQGSVTLSRQEIRHALYPGKLNELLIELAKRDSIKNFGKGKSGKQKKDSLEAEEQVLRFFALQTDLSSYDDRLQDYLDWYMDKNQNPSDDKIAEMKDVFTKALDNCLTVFGDDAFVDTTKGKPKESLVYYDLLMWDFKDRDKSWLIANKRTIITTFLKFCNDDDLRKTVSGGTLSKSKFIRRRKIWEKYMGKIK